MAFKSIYDPDFKYRNALSTDIRLTFQRIRLELEGEGQHQQDPTKVIGRISPQRSNPCMLPSRAGKANHGSA